MSELRLEEVREAMLDALPADDSAIGNIKLLNALNELA